MEAKIWLGVNECVKREWNVERLVWEIRECKSEEGVGGVDGDGLVERERESDWN